MKQHFTAFYQKIQAFEPNLDGLMPSKHNAT